MSNNIVFSGNKGDKIHSDCFVTLEIKEYGAHNIKIDSKAETYDKTSIKKLAEDILLFFKIDNAYLEIIDLGAIPTIIAARVEAAIKKLIETDREYIMPFLEENNYEPQKDNFRFSCLYVPGNSPKMMLNAGKHKPNGIILDLEDSVAQSRKYEARIMVRNALCGINLYGAERMVRINQFPEGLKDLKYIIPYNLHLVVIPKCEGTAYIQEIQKEIDRIKAEQKIENEIYLIPVIESALGVENAFEIATATPKIVAIAIGLEDYTADIGTKRTKNAKESFYARSRIVNACKAAKIQAIDSVFSDVRDEEGLRTTVKESKALGFDGIGCIHPKQIKVIHETFAPDMEEIEKAKKIINAYHEAEERGLGAVSVDSEMIDPPVVKRAQKNIDLAIYLGLISENWREEFKNEGE
jgi:citrate lyase subunit beta/citryl-CoA lyase